MNKVKLSETKTFLVQLYILLKKNTILKQVLEVILSTSRKHYFYEDYIKPT